MNNKKITIRYLFLATFFLFIVLVFFLTRSPYVSDKLKGMIIPELEAVTGKKITVQKIYFNIIPFYVAAKDVEVFTDNGDVMLTVNKVKGYIDLMHLLERNISIQRLIFNDPHIISDREQIEKTIDNIKTYSKKKDDEDDTDIKIKVEVGIIECVNGVVSFTDKETASVISIDGLDGTVYLEEEPEIKVSMKNFDVEKSGWPDLTGDFKTSVVLKKDTVEVKSLELGSYGSRLKGKGSYSKGKSSFKTDIALLVDSVKRFFNLRQKGDGKISAQGEVRFGKVRSLNDIFIDLELKGDFYLETLMELVKVKDPLEGLIDMKGKLQGPLSDISGKAEVRLRKGNIYNVSVDELTCDVSYRDKTFIFDNGVVSLYNGNARASSTLTLPGPEAFTLHVAFDGIDSSGAFKLIGWDPGIPEGKVAGELSSSGKEFSPDGRFHYVSNQQTDENVIGRINDIQGSFSLRNHVISFPNILLQTDNSSLDANGTVDIAQKKLNLDIALATNEVSDLSLPYYSNVSGNGDLSCTVTGSFDNPKLSGTVQLSHVSLENYAVDNFIATFSYNKNLLSVKKAVFSSPNEEHTAYGTIAFPEAQDLFDLDSPVYSLNVSIRNADFGHFLNIVSENTPAKGSLNADVTFDTKDQDYYISGNASLVRAAVFDIPFDSASLDFSYGKEELQVKHATIRNGSSVLTAEGTISSDNRFSYIISSNKLLIKDLGLEHMPDDVIVKLQSQGDGTFQDPSITLTAQVIGGSFKGRTIGSGTIEFSVKNKNILLTAALFNEKLVLEGNGYLDERLPWNAHLTFQPGRYDFIIAAILKDAPEDLQLDLSGAIDMNGDRENINVSATINHFLLSLFGQTFSNESDIRFSVNNKKISLAALTVKSGSASFRLMGGLEIGKNYDIFLDGSSALAPLKGLSKKIAYLQGHSDFVITIKGKWDDPDIKGGMNLENASFGLREHPTYISSINGYLTIDKNKITLRDLSGKIGGGNVSISGIVNIKAFHFKSFYGDVKFDNITTFISRNFHVNFDGNLLYRGTLDKQTITGDLKIRRATYKEPLKLSSLIIATKSKEIPKAEFSVIEKTKLNVSISGTRNISIDNNIARAPIKVDVLLRGTLASPVLFGRIESKEGYAYFRNNEFRIISASADFADPDRINPFLNLASETIIQGYKINLNLEGTMENLEMSLTSDPPLEEGEILSLLTVGYTGEQAQTAQSGLSTGLLAGVAQEVLEDRVRNIIGLDRFYIDTYISKTTSTVVPRVTISKRIIGDKLIITYATPFITPHVEEQSLKLEHFVNRDFSLIGTWDEYGGLGGDIKYRFEFK